MDRPPSDGGGPSDATRRRRRRVLAFVFLVVGSGVLLAGQAATAGTPAPADPAGGDGAYPGHTLVAVQAYGWFDQDNGTVRVVDPDGDVVWEYPEREPSHAWVFDAEMLENGNVLVSMGESPLARTADCPEEFGGGGTPGKNQCIHNRVVEVDFETKEVVWEYDWYDAFPTHHEVHDADRLPGGETAIVDMGNNRAFTVNRQGEVTWSWQAENHIAEGTAFWEEYVPEGSADEFRKSGPESDWTHMNDIDHLDNGHFTISIRNFDVVLEVDPATNDIVGVVGRPDDHSVMNEQHNPNVLERHGTMLVADSESDRVRELDRETGEVIWSYDGTGSGEPLRWPRDVDRLPNGNTLVTDSRNFRVLEVNPNGTVVWRYSLEHSRGIVYEADRIRLPDESGYLPEEPDDVPPGDDLSGRTSSDAVGDLSATIDSWLGFVFPPWVGVVELLVGLVGLAGLVGLVVEGVRWRR